MTYFAYDYDFNRNSVHNILEHRVGNWVKQVQIARKARVHGEAMDSLLYLLALDLKNYQDSPVQEWDEELIPKAADLLSSADDT